MRRFDADHDGFVTHKEVMQVWRCKALCFMLVVVHSAQMCGMSADAAKQLISAVDLNGDGKINCIESV